MSLWNRCPSISALYSPLRCDDKRKNQIKTSPNTWWNIKKWMWICMFSLPLNFCDLCTFLPSWMFHDRTLLCFLRSFWNTKNKKKKKCRDGCLSGQIAESAEHPAPGKRFTPIKEVWSTCFRWPLTGEQLVGHLPFMAVQRSFSGSSEIQTESFVPSIQI